jgi:hypothetical protein
MFNKSFLLFYFLCVQNTIFAQIKILFDATKAETAANADWQIDADTYNVGFGTGVPTFGGSGTEANPQRFPTPAQSGVTANTTESFWKGGLSSWGIECVKKGYQVETLPIGATITYGNSSNVQDLSNYKVFVVCEPNILFTAGEKTAILQFVQNGGGLMMIADHDMSDRNFDGFDSPAIWNNLMASGNPFGMTFDLQDFSQTSSNFATSAGNTPLQGSFGTVTKVQFSGGTSLTLSPSANATVKGAVYKTGSSTTGTTNVMVAYCNYGSGKVVAVGDSSPADDGTGDINDILYDGWIADAGNTGNHRKLLMNATEWLAAGAVPITLTTSKQDVNCFGQNTGSAAISASGGTTPYTYLWSNGTTNSTISGLLSGTYTVTVSGGTTATASVVVNQPNSAVTTSISVSNITCDFPTGTMKVNASGGTPSYTYKWSNGATTATINPTVAGTYTATVTDNKGCIATQTSNLSESKQKPDATILGNLVLTCANPTTILSAQTPNKDYKWSGPSLTTTQLQNTTVTVAGIYNLTITDFANGCSSKNTVTVTENKSSINSNIIGNEVLTCTKTSITLTTNNVGKTYKWSFPDGKSSTDNTITTSLSGQYSLTVTDVSNGCSSKNSISVAENKTLPDATIIGLTTLSCANPTTVLSAQANGKLYNWSFNNTAVQFITVTLPAVYTLTVTEPSSGCTKIGTATVSGNTTPTTVVTLGSTTDATNNLKNGGATIKVSGGTPLYTYEWKNSNNKIVATTKDLTNVAAGVYICKIMDKGGCSVLFTVVIKNVTATQDVDNQSIVNIFPNPTNNVFYVEMKNTNTAFLSVYDLNGRIFLQENIKSNQAISTDSFPKGMYVLKINTSDRSIFRKLVVE